MCRRTTRDHRVFITSFGVRLPQPEGQRRVQGDSCPRERFLDVASFLERGLPRAERIEQLDRGHTQMSSRPHDAVANGHRGRDSGVEAPLPDRDIAVAAHYVSRYGHTFPVPSTRATQGSPRDELARLVITGSGVAGGVIRLMST